MGLEAVAMYVAAAALVLLVYDGVVYTDGASV
jgi:hypothetical protein